MAKLPDATALGARPAISVGRGLAGYSVPDSNAGRIVSSAGQSVQGAGQITAGAGRETEAAGAIIKHAAAQVEATGDEIYKTLKVQQERIDTTRAEDAFTKLRERQLDLSIGQDNGFANVKGGSANSDMMTGWMRRFREASQQIEDGLENDEQKAKYRMRASAAATQFQHDLFNHAHKEAEAFQKQTFEGGVATEVRAASSRFDDPQAVSTSLARIRGLVDERASTMNWPADYKTAVFQQEAGKLHSAVIGQAIASGQWQYAQQWYEANKGDVDPQTAKQLEVAVKDGTQKQIAAGYTADFLAGRNNARALDDLEKRISGDAELDDTRKNALLGRVMSRRETLERRAEAYAREQERILERSIGRVNANTLAGYEPTIEQITPIVNAARGTALEAEANQMLAIAKATRQFRLSTPQQQEAYLSNLEAEVRKDPGKLDIKWVNAFREIYSKQQAALKADPVTFAVRQGMVDTDTPAGRPLDMTDPSKIGPQLTARFQLARAMSERYQAPVKPLTSQEAGLITGTLSRATREQKLNYFAGLVQASGGDMDGYKAVMGQIAPDDPVTAVGGVYAGRGYQTKDGEIVVGRGTAVAELIFRGQELTRQNTKEDGKPVGGKLWPMPQGKDEKTMHDLFVNMERDAFAGLGAVRSTYEQTAKAIYAALSEKAGDSSGNLDTSRWQDAVKLATGGFTRFNGKNIVLPYGHTESTFRDGLQNRVSAVADRLPETITPRKLMDLPLEMAGDGKYVFRSGDNVVLDKAGKPIMIDFTQSAPFRTSGSAPTAPMIRVVPQSDASRRYQAQ